MTPQEQLAQAQQALREQQAQQAALQAEMARNQQELSSRRVFNQNLTDLYQTNLRTGALNPENAGLASVLMGGTASRSLGDAATSSVVDPRRRRRGLASALGLNL